jgi:glucokinase
MGNSVSITQHLLLALDIGGTKLAAALVTPDGQILAHHQEPTSQAGPQAGIAQIIRLLETVRPQISHCKTSVAAIGVGIPAVLEPLSDRVIWAPNLAGWRDIALRPVLEDHFHLPTCIEYDGHTAVLGEWWQGAGRGYHSVVNIIIGTGVGGGMILDGNLVRGASRLAGAAGWSVLAGQPDVFDEPERSLGFWEARIAGPGLARRAQALLQTGEGGHSSLSQFPGVPSAAEIYSAARQGDPLARCISDEQAVLLGIGLANIVSLVNPEVIILGGSVGAACGFLLPRIKETIQRCAQPVSASAVEVVPSTLGAQAGLLGAAYAALIRFKKEADQPKK